MRPHLHVVPSAEPDVPLWTVEIKVAAWTLMGLMCGLGALFVWAVVS